MNGNGQIYFPNNHANIITKINKDFPRKILDDDEDRDEDSLDKQGPPLFSSYQELK